MNIENLLKGKKVKEKAQIKSREIAKLKIGKYSKDNLEVEIIGDIKEIDGGIELFATAYKNGKQCGFGKDGSIEIERFRYFNPPILVDDEKGDIIREWKNKKGETKQRKLREDKEEVIKQILLQTIKLVGKEGKNIIKGKIGNTTSTFYASLDGESGASDASSWYTAHDKTSGNDWENGDAASTDRESLRCANKISPKGITRLFFFFDTSALGDTDTIDSAVLSLYQTSGWGNAGSDYLVIAGATPASDDALVAGDYDQVGTTQLSDRYTYPSNGSLNKYRDYTFNETGEGSIDKTGYSIFSQRTSYDILRSAPGGDRGMRCQSINYTGTTRDPKLVVVHEPAPAGKSFAQII